jgi:hypothetical protein
MHSNFDKGGLGVPDTFSIVKASKLMWIKKYITQEKHGWKTLFEHALIKSHLDPQLLFFCNFDIKQWNTKSLISTFYREVLTEWFKYNNSELFNKDQIIWYNKNILIHKQPIHYKDFADVGIQFLSDLYERNSIIPFAAWKNKGLTNVHFMKWRGLISLITNNIHIDAANQDTTSTIFETLDKETLTYNNKPLNILTSKMVYDHILTIKNGGGVFIPRIAKYINLPNNDWSIQYLNAQKIPIDTKTREFQFKFLHDILVNNFWLKKWNLVTSDKCTFCNTMTETTLHLFWECTYSQNFWVDFNRIYAANFNTVVDINAFVCGSQNISLCTLIFMAKRYIYQCKYADQKPDITIFKHRVNYVKNTEFEIAKRNGTILKYMEKWEFLEQNN